MTTTYKLPAPEAKEGQLDDADLSALAEPGTRTERQLVFLIQDQEAELQRVRAERDELLGELQQLKRIFYRTTSVISQHLDDCHSGTNPSDYVPHANGSSTHKLALAYQTAIANAERKDK